MTQGNTNAGGNGGGSSLAATIADQIAAKARTEQPQKSQTHGVDDAVLERMGKEFLAALDTKDPKQVARLLRAHIRALRGRNGD